MRSKARYWERKFSDDDFTYGRQPNAFLRHHARGTIPDGGRVLSLGEGEGRNAVWLAQCGYEMHAVDWSKAALEKLHALADEHGVSVQTHRADVLDFEIAPDHWDAILLLHMHLLPEDRRVVHRRAASGLVQGGHVLLEALRPEQLGQPSDGPDDLRRLYRPRDLLDDFETLRVQHLCSENRHIEAGEHRGPTSVVQFIGRRGRSTDAD